MCVCFWCGAVNNFLIRNISVVCFFSVVVHRSFSFGFRWSHELVHATRGTMNRGKWRTQSVWAYFFYRQFIYSLFVSIICHLILSVRDELSKRNEIGRGASPFIRYRIHIDGFVWLAQNKRLPTATILWMMELLSYQCSDPIKFEY